jgi:allatostatin receptor
MSVDRYLAMHSFSTNRYRSKKNAIRAVTILWCTVLAANLPQLYLHSHHEYLNHNETRTVCILKYNIILLEAGDNDPIIEDAEFKIQIYYSIFIMFAYVVPFISIVILYTLLMLKLKKAKGKQVSKGKRRITFMIVAVISSFALCWAPIQIMLFLQHILKVQFGETEITLLVLSNCIGYMNTCINPIIYGFANRDFRTLVIFFYLFGN